MFVNLSELTIHVYVHMCKHIHHNNCLTLFTINFIFVYSILMSCIVYDCLFVCLLRVCCRDQRLAGQHGQYEEEEQVEEDLGTKRQGGRLRREAK